MFHKHVNWYSKKIELCFNRRSFAFTKRVKNGVILKRNIFSKNPFHKDLNFRYYTTRINILENQIGKLNLPCDLTKLNHYVETLNKEYHQILNGSLNKESMKRKSFLEQILKIWDAINIKHNDVIQLQNLIKELEIEKSDNEMLKLAYDDLSALYDATTKNYEHLINNIIPADEVDNKDIIIELNAGVGGQEAMLFTQDITKMYCDFSNFKGWSCDITEYDTSDIGFVVHCQISRSQHQNQDLAKMKLRAMIYEQQLNQALKEQKSNRKLQIGTAGRSEKIRTYNYVQDRITDHRLGKNYYNMDEFLKGNQLLSKLIDDLMNTTKAEILNSILDQQKPPS